MRPEAFFSVLFEVRRMIEPEAALVAAQRGSDAKIAAIGVGLLVTHRIARDLFFSAFLPRQSARCTRSLAVD